MSRWFIPAALALLAGPCAASAQSARATDTVSAPIQDVRYDVTFERANAERRMVDVTMSFATAGTAPVILSLPAWTPGAYELSFFSRWVTGFDATGDGHALTWDKLDYETWRVRPAGAKRVQVRFQYAADSLDNAMTWAGADFLLFNGTNLFLYPEGRSLDFSATVTVHTEPDWRVVTSMPRGARPRSYTAGNYHDLVDMPFFVGRFDVDSERILNRWVRLATYPMGAVAGQVRQTAWDQLRRVIPPESAVFGETPWESYSVLEIVDSTFGGASGLEHQSSHVDVLAPAYVGSDFQPSLFAHEIFHSWNVKRLRPSEMWPYQYSHAQPTPWLWVSEGITDYYADLAEVRGGVVDANGFYALTAAKINEVMNTVPASLEDASLSTWVHPVDGTEYLYYAKGSLAGFALDLLIRDASGDAHSLDDVMRNLYQTVYKHGRGFTSADWWGAVRAAAGGRAFDQFNARYVDGRASFPWDSLLAISGLRMRQEQVPHLGVLTQPDSSGIVVVDVEEGSSAASAGVRPGDRLISVGEIPVDDQQFGARLRAKYGASLPGSSLPITVRRNGQALTLAGKLQFAPGDVTIQEDPNATEKAVRIRESLLKAKR